MSHLMKKLRMIFVYLINLFSTEVTRKSSNAKDFLKVLNLAAGSEVTDGRENYIAENRSKKKSVPFKTPMWRKRKIISCFQKMHIE